MSALAHYSTPTLEVYYLYKITNSINSKVYVGVTNNPVVRWAAHNSKTSSCIRLKNAMNKHGCNNFKMEIICIGEKEYILDLEEKVVDSWDLVANGYNAMRGGRGVSKLSRPDRPVWDSPIHVSGWWFPNVDQALKSLNWTKSKLNTRKYSGTLENICHRPKEKPKEIYYKDFWFPCVELAEQKLNQPRKVILSYHYRLRERNKCLN